MLTESRKEFNEVLDTYEVPLAQFKADEWKRAVVSHAHGKEAFLSFVLFDFAITSFEKYLLLAATTSTTNRILLLGPI